MAVVFALWLREVKKYLRSRVQIVASLGGPLMYLGDRHGRAVHAMFSGIAML